MPGPCSKPLARDVQGRVVAGKTRLAKANLASGENATAGDYAREYPAPKVAPKFDLTPEIDEIAASAAKRLATYAMLGAGVGLLEEPAA